MRSLNYHLHELRKWAGWRWGSGPAWRKRRGIRDHTRELSHWINWHWENRRLMFLVFAVLLGLLGPTLLVVFGSAAVENLH